LITYAKNKGITIAKACEIFDKIYETLHKSLDDKKMTPQKVFINDIIYASNNGFKMKVTLLGWV